MSYYSLVIIDVQYYFSASRKNSVIKNCKLEIKRARKAKMPIIFVEYKGCGPTLPSLVKLTKSYARTFFITKNDEDGSKVINNLLKSHNLPSRYIKICGVNTDQCVYATVKGLSKNPIRKSLTLEVKSKACNSRGGHKYGLQLLQQLSSVIIKK